MGHSGDEMVDMYWLPRQDSTVFFGDGMYQLSDGSFYGHTDVGFMRHMLFYGVFGELVGYASLIILMYVLYSIAIDTGMKLLKILSVSVLFLAVFFEVKGTSYNIFFQFISTIIFLAACERKYNHD